MTQGRAFWVFLRPWGKSVFPSSDGSGFFWRVSFLEVVLGMDQPWMVPFYKLCEFSGLMFYLLGQTESLWKSYLKFSPHGSFQQYLKLSVVPEPRKQRCYKGIRKHWTHLSNKDERGVDEMKGNRSVWAPKRWTHRNSKRYTRSHTLRKKKNGPNTQSRPCILAMWQVSSW